MYTLTNAKQMNATHPDTFEIPTDEEIAKLQPGALVKLIFTEAELTPERMWVRITNISSDDFEGVLDNDPLGLATIKYEDVVQFKAHHICAIF